MAACIKLKREFTYMADRQTMKARAIEIACWKNISKYVRKLKQGRL